MCDPVLIAAILTALSSRSAKPCGDLPISRKIGFSKREKEKDKKGEVRAERPKQDNSKDSGEEEQKQK